MQFIYNGRIIDPVHGDMGEAVLYDWSKHFKKELHVEYVDALVRWCDDLCCGLNWKWIKDDAAICGRVWIPNLPFLGGVIARGGPVLHRVLSQDCFAEDMAVLGRLQVDVACRLIELEHGPMGLNWERGWEIAREYASAHFNQTRIRACEKLENER